MLTAMSRLSRNADRGQLPTIDELRDSFGGIKHARLHDSGVVYHHMIRTVQGRFLLRPDKDGVLVKIIAGAVARAQLLYPSVQLYADAWLSNHAHLELQGDPYEVPNFTGFIEREISRRWGPLIGWEGNMFQTYQSTALPTEESQQRALRYILAQSAKEHLVESPRQWPGAHCAKDFARGLVRRGVWFDGTAYGRALDRHKARKRKHAAPKRRDFTHTTEMRFTKLPCLDDVSDDAYREHIRRIVTSIETEAAEERRKTNGKLVGRRRVLQIPRETRSALPSPPWFEKRRRMICWADRWADATKRYLQRYWAFQRSFREASKRFLEGELDVAFPPGAFRPSCFVPTAALSR